MRKEKSEGNAVAELTREGLYKENKWLWEENRKLKEKLSKITMVADDEKQSIEHILELEEENKKLKEEVEVWKNANKKLRMHDAKMEYENKKLKEELGEYKKMFEDHLKECYIKNTAEFMDKKFTLENGFMEEDTLQELRDLGKI